ncbi:hypothetical protein COW36_20720 [bacterium (Candidatus Blackallbacteria) CG17_big_fil_post_rev_8_21_14_2_50_48_46]|uniref:non-specific serine/threonine protein kinase n=1 Tax=bacterium (Candidatus Blackallbacteria) CG17_big_fil_post_rev_8_21_14_2_50_48_46 TaxID=2014261 RepID=A0A2M7FZA2_9BACT|nr:MAG: hypothetical protein COW64_14030 [bacterium (Candidatus Blackallbacteria) CG18_big_fil_WC_8_21_14_2_50_49_26]PIW14466.1 MAG: hypothetical protein COW36_20720 [bacterium (Candidatus Blackallbacteria) CG17_big_fil_post_rev_8_21_14_2_50_48_46]PIW47152.1 MAG: hypothetical protein COW20_13165 [bacterium (Candidatus Blackallbacteria) CG13_big_fil_rev_8_21_14_2_50_49_14]
MSKSSPAAHYQIIAPLGQGGFATTWLAKDTRTGQRCALKKLSLHKLDHWKSLELFERECKVLKNLKHTGIPRFIESWNSEDPFELVLVQEYIPGKSLQTWIEEGRRFSEDEALQLALQICDILIYLHRFSPPVVHRDLKPGNLILNEQDQIFLIDFGAVKQQVSAQAQHSITMMGTVGYIPLEQLEGRALPASDLYALGATLLFLLTGRSPAELPKKDLKPDFRSQTHFSMGFNRILDRLLDADLNKRYALAAELKRDLLKLIEKQQKRNQAFDFDKFKLWQTVPKAWAGFSPPTKIGMGLGVLLLSLPLLLQGLKHLSPTPPPKKTQAQTVETANVKMQSLRWQAAPLKNWQRLEPAPNLISLSQTPQGQVWGIASNALYLLSGSPDAPIHWEASKLTGGYASLNWLQATQNQGIWFASSDSHLYRLKDNTCLEMDKPSPAKITALGIWQDKLLLAAGPQLYFWDTRSDTFQLLGKLQESIEALYSDADKVLWVGDRNRLYRYEGKTWQKVWEGKSSYDDRIRVIRQAENKLWLGLEKGALALDLKRNLSYNLLNNGSSKGLESMPQQARWLATSHTYAEGLYQFKNGQAGAQTLGWRDGLPDDRFQALLLDAQAQLWFSGQSGELWKTPTAELLKQMQAPKPPAHPALRFESACAAWQGLQPAPSAQLAGDGQSGDLRVYWNQQQLCPYGEGFRSQQGELLELNWQGLKKWTHGKVQKLPLPERMLSSQSLWLDSKQRIWLARRYPYILLRFVNQNWQKFGSQQGFSEGSAALLYETRAGKILAGSKVKGELPLQVFDESSQQWLNSGLKYQKSWMTPEAKQILELHTGQLALATDEGLFLIEADFKQAQKVEGLPYKEIQGVAEDAQHRLWIIYDRHGKGRGLSLWDPAKGKVSHLDSRQGLVPDRFQEIAIDSQKRLWLMGGGMGVAVYTQAPLEKAMKALSP